MNNEIKIIQKQFNKFYNLIKENLTLDEFNIILKESIEFINIFFENTKLNDFNDHNVIKIVYLNDSKLDVFSKLFNDIEKNEKDINLMVKFLTDHRIKSKLCIDSKPCEKKIRDNINSNFHSYEWNEFQKIDNYFLNPKISACSEILNMQKYINTLSIDIETVEDKIISISFYDKNNKIVIFNHEKAKLKQKQNFEIIIVNDEKKLLNKFIEIIHKLDPDIITGWAVIDFDFNFIYKRMKFNKISCNLGRVPLSTRIIIQDNFLKTSTCYVPGRIIIDGIAILKDNFVKFNDYKLDTVAKEFLGEQKIASGSDVQKLYDSNHDKLLEYNLIDSKLVYDIIVGKDFIKIAIARSEITGMTIDRLDKAIATLDYLYLITAKNKKIVIPDGKEFNRQDPIEGGYVRDPIPGIYDNILVFDFKSLYPSIMATLNIDKYTYLGNIENEKKHKPFDKEDFFNQKIKQDIVISPTGAMFELKDAILPELLLELLKVRDIAKEENDDIKSYAIKVIMVSFYGSLASPYYRFYSTDIAGSVTAFARTIIKKTAELLQEKDFEIIYGDTDSIFVNAKITDDKKILDLGDNIINEINKYLDKLIKNKFNRKNYIELEFEKVYRKFILPKVRGQLGGAKKRYAGIKRKRNGKEKIDVVGLEAVRRDWVEAAKEFQLGLLDIIFNNKNPQQKLINFTKKTIDDIKSGKFDDKLQYRKGLRKSVDSYTKMTPPHVKAAKLLDKIENDIIIYYLTIDGPQPIQKLNSKIDYEHYIEKQIKPIAESIFLFFDLTFDDVLKGSNQKKLFGY